MDKDNKNFLQVFIKNLPYLSLGIIFGISFVKGELISWYRMQEMFRFQSFHMYGIIISAIVVGMISLQIIKRAKAKTIRGKRIHVAGKAHTYTRYILGGTIFGLGWAMTGSCPGPMITLMGYGASIYIVMFLSALLGTWAYGVLRSKLPH